MKMPVNYQVSADNDYSTDENTEYLEKTWTLTVTYPHENSQEKEKKIVNNCPKNHFSKR